MAPEPCRYALEKFGLAVNALVGNRPMRERLGMHECHCLT
jgi:hypothetical protein